ncbi:MAG: DUF4123 domain-containing protein, partial [Paracoccus sp. (in: a-proteobacteria)]
MDYWTGYWPEQAGIRSVDDRNRFLHVEPLEGIEPIAPKAKHRELSSSLRSSLFGGLSKAEAANTADRHESTYAILDATKIFGLPETLDGSGLHYQCLYQGDALTENGDFAPWVVRLEESNRLTKALFTLGESPLALWQDNVGIFLRTRLTLDQLCRHLRRFVRLRDEDGQWYYFRFWEPLTLLALCRHAHQDEALARRFFIPETDEALEFIAASAKSQFAIKCVGTREAGTGRIYLPSTLIEILGRNSELNFLQNVTDLHFRLFRTQVGLRGPENILQNNIAITETAKVLGCTTKFEVSYLCFMAIWLGRGLLNDPLIPWVRKNVAASGGMARVIAWRKAFDQHIAEVHGRNGEYLAAACRKLLGHIDNGLSEASLPEPTHSAMHAFLQRVYPQKYEAAGQRNVEQFLRDLQPHPLLTHHGRSGSWFYGVAAFMLGREFASDPTSPF